MSPLLYLERLIRHGHAAPADLAPASSTWGLHHAVLRLARSFDGTNFGLDQAILLRQCLRLLEHEQSIVVDKVSPDVQRHFAAVGLRRAVNGTIEATPFEPSWLTSATPQGIDVPAVTSVLDDDPTPGEGWLSARLGKHTWRSQAQREATWEALTAPQDSTCLIGLPTGAGKSLVYQVCAALELGLTVVVVPTVALGLDQIEALRDMPIAETHAPSLYTSDENSESVLQAVRAKECRLLVTSPEAIVAGRLGSVLETHAQDGWLTRLVVDEAHIVDSWGASFRVEFQLLGAHLRKWRSVAPIGVRALLLSATFGPGTASTLKTLFATEGNGAWTEYVIQRLRPEVNYFSPGRALSEAEHKAAVIEALHHLPRPAILYLTEREDVERWKVDLVNAGLRRLEGFHGRTPRIERLRILQAWRQDELDLVIATSAFGMGVDKADVRSVVHACFPENIDRYYQEVGRGGRDGAPSSSVALWTAKDRATGGGMGPKLIKDEIKIRQRWAAMWSGAQASNSAGSFKIPLWVSPNYKLHERTYEESVTWNKRLILLMERAAVLRVVGLYFESDDADGRREWAFVDMLHSTISLEERLPSLLQAARGQELLNLATGRERLDRVLSNDVQVCRVLREHYGRPTYRTCGSCAQCRMDPSIKAGSAPLILRLHQITTSPLVDVVHGPSLSNKKDEGKVAMALRRVMQDGMCVRFFTGLNFHPRAKSLLELAAPHGGLAYRLDPLTSESAQSVHPGEAVVCLHGGSMHPQAHLLNMRGALCGHWLFGVQSEGSGSVWPFLHQSGSRLFAGPDALNDWMNSRQEFCKTSRETASVH